MSHSLLNVLNNPFSVWFWLLWAVFLVWQNYAFTYVSRARNSASLKSHAMAALQSNGIWFVQTIFIFTAFQSIFRGTYGLGMTLFAVLYYTAFTMSGSLWAHYRRLRKEAGDNAVGANKKYAQIAIEDWRRVEALVGALDCDEGAQLPERLSKMIRSISKTALEAEAGLKEATGRIVAVEAKAEKFSESEFARVKHLAEQAYDITSGMIPESGVTAVKIAGQVVTTGLPENK